CIACLRRRAASPEVPVVGDDVVVGIGDIDGEWNTLQKLACLRIEFLDSLVARKPDAAIGSDREIADPRRVQRLLAWDGNLDEGIGRGIEPHYGVRPVLRHPPD